MLCVRLRLIRVFEISPDFCSCVLARWMDPERQSRCARNTRPVSLAPNTASVYKMRLRADPHTQITYAKALGAKKFLVTRTTLGTALASCKILVTRSYSSVRFPRLRRRSTWSTWSAVGQTPTLTPRARRTQTAFSDPSPALSPCPQPPAPSSPPRLPLGSCGGGSGGEQTERSRSRQSRTG